MDRTLLSITLLVSILFSHPAVSNAAGMHALQVESTATLSSASPIMTADGWRIPYDKHLLPGNALWQTCKGPLSLETVEETVPSKVRLFNRAAELQFFWEGRRALNLTLSSRGRFAAWSDGDTLHLLDCLTLEKSSRPGSWLFALNEQGRLATVFEKDGQILLLVDDYHFELMQAVRGLAWHGEQLLLAGETGLFALHDDKLSEACPMPGCFLRFERDHDGLLLVVRDRSAFDAVLARFRVNGLNDLQYLDTQDIADVYSRNTREHEPILCPMEAVAGNLYPIGNSYGEIQQYGAQSYLHPGVDFLGADNEIIRAVTGGVVKAVLTTGGEYYWRVAIGSAAGADSLQGYLYAHLNQESILVAPGDTVAVGDQIGTLVPWPVEGFTHLHFARIAEEGLVWQGDWWTVDDPLQDVVDFADNSAPVFGRVQGLDFFAFRSAPDVYQDPQNLSGPLQIVSHVSDISSAAWHLDVAGLSWELRPSGETQVVANGIALERDMPLDVYLGGNQTSQVLETIYARDNTYWSIGNYNEREYYQLLPSDNGDGLFQPEDSQLRFETQDLPDGAYDLTVEAWDFAGNVSSASMPIVLANGNAPLELGLSIAGHDVHLQWNEIAGVDGYLVERREGAHGDTDWQIVAEPVVNQWTDVDALINSPVVSYRVRWIQGVR